MKNNPIEGQISLFDRPYVPTQAPVPIRRELSKKPSTARVYRPKHRYIVYYYDEVLLEIDAYSEKQANKLAQILKGKYGTYVQLIR